MVVRCADDSLREQSGLFASLINISQFFIIAQTGAVSSTVVGHLKTCTIVALGWFVSGRPIGDKSIIGVAVAIGGITMYEPHLSCVLFPIFVSSLPFCAGHPLMMISCAGHPLVISSTMCDHLANSDDFHHRYYVVITKHNKAKASQTVK